MIPPGGPPSPPPIQALITMLMQALAQHAAQQPPMGGIPPGAPPPVVPAHPWYIDAPQQPIGPPQQIVFDAQPPHGHAAPITPHDLQIGARIAAGIQQLMHPAAHPSQLVMPYHRPPPFPPFAGRMHG